MATTSTTRLALVAMALVLIAPAPRVSAGNASDQAAECYAAIRPALQAAGGRLTPDLRGAYEDWAETRVLRELKVAGRAVVPACVAEAHGDSALRDAMYGSVYPPDPSVLQNYATLRSALGASFATKYRSLLIAIAVAKRTKGAETVAEAAAVGRDYQPGFWTDESLRPPGSDAEKELVHDIAAFMEQAQVSAQDLYHSADRQAQLRQFLTQRNTPANFLAEIKTCVPFGERLKNAMVALGQRPAAREPKPDTVAWIRHLAEIYEARPPSTPAVDGKTLSWPLFPLDRAPWPLLMPLAHPVPLSEAAYIWEAFQGQHGDDRYHTYGPYRGDDDVIANSLNPSRWFWDAWPDRIVHGGECVPISKGTVDLYSALGKPAMWAGQPGHANLITFQYANGVWTAENEQAFAGGPDVTFAQWYFDEDPGSQIRFRDLYYWAGAEYHLGLAAAMNVGLKSYMDTRIAAHIYRAIPDADRPTLGVGLLQSALQANPYNPEIWYRLAEVSANPKQALALTEAAVKGDTRWATGDSARIPAGGPAAAPYWHTLAPFVARSALLAHAAPQSETDIRRAHELLAALSGLGADELGRYAEKCATLPDADAMGYDRQVADAGNAFGELRLGQRYLFGDGVPQDDGKATDLLRRAAAQGDIAAASVLTELTPTVPANRITVTASSTFGTDQAAVHLIDGTGLSGAVHDNEGSAKTMWHTAEHAPLSRPAKDLPVSPAWARFDFSRPQRVQAIEVWNHNQAKLTDRGFRGTRVWGSADGVTWLPLTPRGEIVLPQAPGTPFELPITVSNVAADLPLSAVVIEAQPDGGNYGGTCYGLSAVRFVVPGVGHAIPSGAIAVTASSVYSSMQAERNLVEGTGLVGTEHDNAHDASTMWHTVDHPAATVPAAGLAPSPAWVRFDFAQPRALAQVLIWNHNQEGLTDRGFRKARIYASADGATWRPLTATAVVELPRVPGTPGATPTAIATDQACGAVRSVIIAAEPADGNYGGNCYGLSAVRFVVR